MRRTAEFLNVKEGGGDWERVDRRLERDGKRKRERKGGREEDMEA